MIQTDELELLTVDNVLDDLERHEHEGRASVLETPFDVVEKNMHEILGINPRVANRELIQDGYIPHPLQKVVHETMMDYRFTVLVCHRRWGKTVLAINSLCDAAVRNCGVLGNPGRYAYIAPLLKQAKQVSWLYLKAFAQRVENAKKHEGELYVEFPNGSRITLYGAAPGQFESMRGLFLDGAVFDEPAQMKPEVYSEVVRPALADHEGWCLMIGTPHGVDMFSERYDHAVIDDDWCAFKFPIDETDLPWLPPEEVELIRRELTVNQFRQEFLCDFASSSEDVIITIDRISDAMARKTPSEGYLKGMEVVVGIDPAWMGDDSTAVAIRWGLHMYPIKTFGRNDHDKIVNYLMQVYTEYKPDAWFMDQSYGEGIYARMQGLGVEITLVPFGGGAMDESQFGNRVTEMYFRFNDWLGAGGVLPNDSTLKAEMSAVTYEIKRQGQYDVRQRHPKAKIKEKIGRSPDKADAAVLTTCEQVIPKSRRQSEVTVQVSDGGYHPHKRLGRRTEKPKETNRRR